jgi:quercetin dioxygenase-like cupin family protein
MGEFMTRRIRLYTGPDQLSHVEEIVLPLGALEKAKVVHFEQSQPHAAFDWHAAPCRQYVVTLTGTLEFITRDGETFTLAPGDVLLAEDMTGSGHRWSLIDGAPWLRLYVEL